LVMQAPTDRVLAAGLAGLVATIPMSILMVVAHRRLPWRERQPLPPAKITREALRAAKLVDELSSEEKLLATIANHFAYGAGCGAVYGLLTSQAKVPPVTSGVAYGLGVWAASYLGWLPAAGMHRSALSEPERRNALMIAAHVVYGAGLGILTEMLSRSHDARQQPSSNVRSPARATRRGSTWS
jgi:uncharacterized membrane protein YagU involved in acid resistance